MSPMTALRRFGALLFAATLALNPALVSAQSQATAASSNAPAAGEVLLLTGRGTATDPATGAVRPLSKGDKVYSGDILNTQANSYLNIRFSDGAFMLLRPNTRFAIEAYAYSGPAPEPVAAAPAPAPAPATPTPANRPAAAAPVTPAAPVARTAAADSGVQRSFLRLIKGGFRTVSGLIGKSNAEEYRVTTPVATIGIRGTDYYTFICDLACASDSVIQESLELANVDRGLAVGATLSSVISGSIGVTNAGGQTEVLVPGDYLLTLTDGRQIRLPREPGFLRAQPFPDPATICAP